MDFTALATALPNLAFAIVTIWFLIGQNKELREDLRAASESRLKQLENVVAAMHATATAITAQAGKLGELVEESNAMKKLIEDLQRLLQGKHV